MKCPSPAHALATTRSPATYGSSPAMYNGFYSLIFTTRSPAIRRHQRACWSCYGPCLWHCMHARRACWIQQPPGVAGCTSRHVQCSSAAPCCVSCHDSDWRQHRRRQALLGYLAQQDGTPNRISRRPKLHMLLILLGTTARHVATTSEPVQGGSILAAERRSKHTSCCRLVCWG